MFWKVGSRGLCYSGSKLDILVELSKSKCNKSTIINYCGPCGKVKIMSIFRLNTLLLYTYIQYLNIFLYYTCVLYFISTDAN